MAMAMTMAKAMAMPMAMAKAMAWACPYGHGHGAGGKQPPKYTGAATPRNPQKGPLVHFSILAMLGLCSAMRGLCSAMLDRMGWLYLVWVGRPDWLVLAGLAWGVLPQLKRRGPTQMQRGLGKRSFHLQMPSTRPASAR